LPKADNVKEKICIKVWGGGYRRFKKEKMVLNTLIGPENGLKNIATGF
jgi:hypothetical protein